LQDFLKATTPLNVSAASNQDSMAGENTSAISPKGIVSAPKAPVGAGRSSTLENAGFISGMVITGVLALAVLVALGIFLRRKLNSSRTVQPPGKIIVRFRFDPRLKEPDRSFNALSYA
jgi:hypothetical protein